MDKVQRKNKKTTTSRQNGFFETLIVKSKPKTVETVKQSAEICNKMNNTSDLMKKKYMIPSQFPNITQRVVP